MPALENTGLICFEEKNITSTKYKHNTTTNTLEPTQVAITATSIGPIVKPDQDNIAWGPTQCLVDAPRSLQLSNPGKIPAPFKVFLRSSRSKYRVDIREGVLAPSEVYISIKNKKNN